jgi:sarcosine oxidase subunit beta
VETADVVVIGGGIVGVCTAYALARRGVHRVVLLDKGALAGGATGRSSALIRLHYTNERDARLAWASSPTFAHWPDASERPTRARP